MNELQSVGALWKAASESGRKYLNGSLDYKGERLKIMVFVNDRKKEEKHPDYNVMLKSVEAAPVKQPPKPMPTAEGDEEFGF